MRGLTNPDGVDCIFGAAGGIPALEQGLSLLAPGCTAVIVGVQSHDLTLRPVSLLPGEPSITGTCAYDRQDFPDVIEAMGRRVYDLKGPVADRRSRLSRRRSLTFTQAEAPWPW